MRVKTGQNKANQPIYNSFLPARVVIEIEKYRQV